MFQRVTLIGNVGQDPQMRYTPDGVPVTDFSLATTESISKSSPSGERPCPQGWKESYNGKNWEITTWWKVTCWRGLAETVNRFLGKGRKVFVEGTMSGKAVDGTLRVDVYESGDEHRAQYAITARTVKFLDSASSTSNDEPVPLDPPAKSEGDGW